MAKDKDVQDAILKTLCYADVFEYPLTRNQIHRFLIHDRKASGEVLHRALLKLIKRLRVGEKQGYFFLSGRSRIVSHRQTRRKFSKQKMVIAQRVGRWLQAIPTIRMVALTGALAMENADEGDDIDLMIVTRPDRLWLTRLLVVPLVSVIAKRRRPERQQGRTKVRWGNAICLNLWLEETALSVSRQKRNIYTAHEVAQTKPLWSRDGTYERFLFQNSWLQRELPNMKIPTKDHAAIKRWNSETPLNWFESLAFKLQALYMKPKKKRETVTLHSAFFHPRDTATLVLAQYQQRLRERQAPHGQRRRERVSS